MRVLLAQQAQHQGVGETAELLHERSPQRLGPGDVVRAVEQDQRVAADDFQAPGCSHPAERVVHDIARKLRVDEGFRGGERNGRVVALVRAVQRQEHIRILGARCVEMEMPAADGEVVATHAEVDVTADERARHRVR